MSIPLDQVELHHRVDQLETKLDIIITEVRSFLDHITALSILVEDQAKKIDEITRQIKI